MTTYSENAIALDAAEEAVVDTRVIDVDFGAADSDVNEKTMHGNLVYDMAEEDAESELAPDPEVYEAARRIDEERWFYRFAKRAFDIIFSLTVLILFCWLFAIIAIAIKIDDPKGPVIFKQERVGKNGTRFMMWKFRSMYSDAESRLDELMQLNEKTGPVFKIALDPRITRAGKWLRKLSLDELPQFINVLGGKIPLRILKTRPEFSEESMGAFALPAKSSTNKGKVFSQVVSCFASGLRMRRISGFNCKRVGSMEGHFLAKPVFKAVCA